MKKIIAWMLLLTILFALSACSGDNDAGEKDKAPISTEPSESIAPVIEPTGREPLAEDEAFLQSKALVIYFSCTGNTEAVARVIAAQTGADLYEIVPKQPYTEEDLNYQDDDCRANREMNDDSVRPAISGSIENLSDYDTLYIGYPIWWGTMPKILNTFFETYDLSEKTILPFCTSGGSDIAESVLAIREAEPEADVKIGLRIASGSTNNCAHKVAAWLEENNG